MACTWKSEHSFCESVLSFYRVGPGIELSFPCFVARPFTHLTIWHATSGPLSSTQHVLCTSRWQEVTAAGAKVLESEGAETFLSGP